MKIFKLVLIKQYQLTNWVRPLFNCIMWHSWIREGHNRSILNGRSLYWASSIFITAKNRNMLFTPSWHGALLIMLSPYLSELDFSNSPVWNFQFDELIFFPSLNWIFTACVAYKNPVQTRKKSSSSNWKFQTGEFEKSSLDR